MTWRHAGDVALILLYVIPAVGAPIDYARTARWWRSALGWHLMSYMAVAAGFALLGLYRVVGGQDAPGIDVLRFALYAAAGPCLYWRWWVVRRWRRHGTHGVVGATLPSEAVPDRDGPARS